MASTCSLSTVTLGTFSSPLEDTTSHASRATLLLPQTHPASLCQPSGADRRPPPAAAVSRAIVAEARRRSALDCRFAACVWRITDFPRISNSPHTRSSKSNTRQIWHRRAICSATRLSKSSTKQTWRPRAICCLRATRSRKSFSTWHPASPNRRVRIHP